MSFKPLFARSLSADPDRLHFAAHSHHLWPDASFEGQVEAWQDAARFADRKWDRIMGEVWPEAQRHVADELGTDRPDALAFSPNTHDFVLRVCSAVPRRGPKLRLLTSDGEFHSARRQFDRWNEDGWLEIEKVAADPFGDFDGRFLDRARSGDHDLIFLSHVMFSNGHVFSALDELAAIARPDGPWVVIDGYHAFMAVERPFVGAAGESAFYLGGGYKYAMSGEGCAFLHAPPAFGPRPSVTGWFAEFEDLTLSPGMVGYARDGSRFLGATFDVSSLYRFNAVRRMLGDNVLTTARINKHVEALQQQLLGSMAGSALAGFELLNPLGDGGHARFLAFRSPNAARLHDQLLVRNVITDVRGDVLRIGFALYHDRDEVERLAAHLVELS